MNSYVTDTQALIKFMMGQKVINKQCHHAFLSTDIGKTEDLLKSSNYQFEPLSMEILKAAAEIDDIPELHDRLIAATARYLDIPLITNDPIIRKSQYVKILA